MQIERRVHKLDQLIQRQKLGSHTRLIAEEVALLQCISGREDDYARHCISYHARHETHETPECDGIVLHDCIYRRQ